MKNPFRYFNSSPEVIRLAIHEERDTLERFGDEYTKYMNKVPGFLPRLRKLKEFGSHG